MKKHLIWLCAFALVVPVEAIGEEIVGVRHVKNWSVYQSVSGNLECGIISKPTQQVAIKDGKEAVVKRGDIMLAVTVDPNDPAPHYRVSYQSGYPFKKDSTVSLNIDGQPYTLETASTGEDDETDNEFAWPPSTEEDNRVVYAMKNGVSAVITGRSSRGTLTKDTFSLFGVSEALEIAEQRCSVNSRTKSGAN